MALLAARSSGKAHSKIRNSMTGTYLDSGSDDAVALAATYGGQGWIAIQTMSAGEMG